MEGSITKSSKQGDSRYVRTYSLANTTWPRCTILQPGAQVQIVSESVNAVEGETISFDNQVNGSEDGKAQPGAPFKVVNKSGQPATFGVNHFNIISSAPTSLFVSDILFHPIWQAKFSRPRVFPSSGGRERTDIMFDTMSTPTFECNLTGHDEVTLEYKEGQLVG